MMSFICSCRNKIEEPSSIDTLRKVRTIRGITGGSEAERPENVRESVVYWYSIQ
jgi:hypothetical protein